MISLFEYKKEVMERFKESGIDLDEINILFCESLNCSKTDLLLKSNISLSEKSKIDRAVRKRLLGEPIQKIFNRAYFYGLVFYVNKNVLCPRPETELLVEETLRFVGKNFTILDLCTGSGVVAITLAKNSDAKITVSDISSKALDVARKNAYLNQVDVDFVKGNMFQNIYNKFDIIVSNPPYIPTEECDKLDVEVKDYDPRISLDGGKDGLEFYRQIAIYAPYFLKKKGKLLVEVGINEAENVKHLFEQSGFDCHIKKDYNNIERIVVGELI